MCRICRTCRSWAIRLNTSSIAARIRQAAIKPHWKKRERPSQPERALKARAITTKRASCSMIKTAGSSQKASLNNAAMQPAFSAGKHIWVSKNSGDFSQIGCGKELVDTQLKNVKKIRQSSKCSVA